MQEKQTTCNFLRFPFFIITTTKEAVLIRVHCKTMALRILFIKGIPYLITCVVTTPYSFFFKSLTTTRRKVEKISN